MATIYTLSPYIKGCDIMRPASTDYSEEYAKTVCDFYLTDEMQHTYRLHSVEPKRLADFLPLTIKCPKCTGNLTPIDAPINSTDLLLYECRRCKKY